jgi:hypothetical protein
VSFFSFHFSSLSFSLCQFFLTTPFKSSTLFLAFSFAFFSLLSVLFLKYFRSFELLHGITFSGVSVFSGGFAAFKPFGLARYAGCDKEK